MIKLAFTGHRPSKLDGDYDLVSPLITRIKGKILEIINMLNMQTTSKDMSELRIISGMALGIDTLAAQIAIEQDIPFIAAVPFVDQPSMWPPESRLKYRKLLEQADQVVVVSPGPYSAHKMQKRNEWMVDHATHLCAVWDGTPGGTANCVRYARTVMPADNIFVINPKTLTL